MMNANELIDKLTNHSADIFDTTSDVLKWCLKLQNPKCPKATGFRDLDEHLNGGLKNATYIIPGETGTGKTGFCLALAMALANNGTEVMYITLEQSADDIRARIVSDLAYLDGKEIPFSAIDEYSYNRTPYEDYRKYIVADLNELEKKLHIHHPNSGIINVDEIRDLTKKLKATYPGSEHVIIIDYLQIISPSKNEEANETLFVKNTCRALQCLAVEECVTVIYPSAMTKSNVNEEIRSTSGLGSVFSGYSAAFVLGWNWVGVTYGAKIDGEKNPFFDSAKERERCRKRGYRIMMLNFAKARYTDPSVNVFFKYYPAYNHLESVAWSEIQCEYHNLFEKKRLERSAHEKYK